MPERVLRGARPDSPRRYELGTVARDERKFLGEIVKINDRDRVTRGLDAALGRLLKRDSHLLSCDVNERSLTHKLAEYLQGEFRDWNVDCEYNRDHEAPKVLKIPTRAVQADDTDARTVFPDIIIHQRDTDRNLLVIEVKKTSNRTGDDYDLLKLKAFREQLGYRFAVFVKFKTATAKPGIDNVQWL